MSRYSPTCKKWNSKHNTFTEGYYICIYVCIYIYNIFMKNDNGYTLSIFTSWSKCIFPVCLLASADKLVLGGLLCWLTQESKITGLCKGIEVMRMSHLFPCLVSYSLLMPAPLSASWAQGDEYYDHTDLICDFCYIPPHNRGGDLAPVPVPECGTWASIKTKK